MIQRCRLYLFLFFPADLLLLMSGQLTELVPCMAEIHGLLDLPVSRVQINFNYDPLTLIIDKWIVKPWVPCNKVYHTKDAFNVSIAKNRLTRTTSANNNNNSLVSTAIEFNQGLLILAVRIDGVEPFVPLNEKRF